MGKFIKGYLKYIKENKNSSNINSLIIEKGEELFHGTVEKFNIKDIKGGGYDGMLWTTKESGIAQTYIPVSGSKIYILSAAFQKPSKDKEIQDFQKQLGIEYDYSDVEFYHNGQVKSYHPPKIWEKFRDESRSWLDTYNKLEKDVKDKHEELNTLNKELIAKYEQGGDYTKEDGLGIKKTQHLLNNLETKLNNMSKEYPIKGDSTHKEHNYINDKLKSLGYSPEDKGTPNDNNLSWELKTTIGEEVSEIMPSNYRAKGRLLIITPNEDLNIFDYTGGEQLEGDLTDLDYHKTDMFKKAEERGYDGVKINDFAQVESAGNFGHRAIGLFSKTIPKLDIKSIDAEHPSDFSEEDFRKGGYHSKEYKKNKG